MSKKDFSDNIGMTFIDKSLAQAPDKPTKPVAFASGTPRAEKEDLTELLGLKVYTIPTLKDLLNLSARTIQGYISSKRLPAQKIGGKWYVTEDNLKRFVSGQI